MYEENIEPWLDEENLLPGQDWSEEIRKAIKTIEIVIVCLSKGTINKTGFVQKEIIFALDEADKKPEGTIFIIPAKLEVCDIPGRLSQWYCVNLFEEKGYEQLMKALKHRANALNLIAPGKGETKPLSTEKIKLEGDGAVTKKMLRSQPIENLKEAAIKKC